MKSRRFTFLAVLATLLFLASSVQAAVVVGGSDGWSLSTDGMINLFGVYQTQDDIPAGVNTGYATSDEGFRIKSGFLPGILAFNIKAPTMKGLDIGSRIGFYPEPSNANVKNTFDGQIDLREIFFTVDGNFGQVMVGKGLSLFLGQNLLTEQTLMGVGRLGAALNADVGPTLGRIGYGYVYPNFDAQFRYTTPSMAGVKLAVALYDPSQIKGDAEATETKLPRLETEVSYAGTFGDDGTFKAYLNGMWQEATLTSVASAGGKSVGDTVTAWGAGGGFVAGMMGFELVGSAFTGKALGTNTMLDTDSLDAQGKERKTWGYIGQLTYTFANEGHTKLGVSYGVNKFGETAADAADRAADNAFIKEQGMITGMVTYDVTPFLKLVGEVSHITHEWHNGAHWDVNMFSLGTFFLW